MSWLCKPLHPCFLVAESKSAFRIHEHIINSCGGGNMQGTHPVAAFWPLIPGTSADQDHW
jgi:hypothetical protein